MPRGRIESDDLIESCLIQNLDKSHRTAHGRDTHTPTLQTCAPWRHLAQPLQLGHPGDNVRGIEGYRVGMEAARRLKPGPLER